MKKAARVFKSLSDPTRLRIVFLLLEHDLCVCELMAILEMEQSRISHQLRILRDAGLVEDNREGRWIIYRMPESVKEHVRALLERPLGEDPEAEETVRNDRVASDICIRENLRGRVCDVRKNSGQASPSRSDPGQGN